MATTTSSNLKRDSLTKKDEDEEEKKEEKKRKRGSDDDTVARLDMSDHYSSVESDGITTTVTSSGRDSQPARRSEWCRGRGGIKVEDGESVAMAVAATMGSVSGQGRSRPKQRFRSGSLGAETAVEGVGVKKERGPEVPWTVADGSCAYDEALAVRYRAREVGMEMLLQEASVPGRIPLKTLCAVFGVPWPGVAVAAASGEGGVLTDVSRATVLARLKRAIRADMGKRIKLSRYNSVEDAVSLVRDARKIMVITGAGISTSLNIPDFRSSGGLYARLRDMGFEDPENVFSRDAFEQDPKTFLSVAAMILPPVDGRFTPTHAFLKLLQDKEKLLTLYTQNIDGIDLVAGIRRDKLLQLHGSFETATCVDCGHQVKGDEVFPAIKNGDVPGCARCEEERQLRIERVTAVRAQTGRSVRRNPRRSGAEPAADHRGVMRPDIVFMDEPPRPYLKRFHQDCARVDLVMVMGTSLPVEPVGTMPNRVPAGVPQIYIGMDQASLDRTRRVDFDIQLLGECDVVVDLLARRCGWDLRHEMLPQKTAIEIEPACGVHHCHVITRERIAIRCGKAKSESVS